MRFLLTVVLTVFAVVLYAFGWLLGKGAVVVAWCWSAVVVGWDDAHTRTEPGPAGEQSTLRAA